MTNDERDELLITLKADQAALVAEVRIQHEETTRLLQRHDTLLLGNGAPGLKAQVDRLEQKEKTRQWWLRGLGASTVGLAVKAAWDSVVK